MTRMIKLTDTLTGETATVLVYDVANAIRNWYGGPGPMLSADSSAIDEFQAALKAGAYEARELAAFLAVGFDEVAERP